MDRMSSPFLSPEPEVRLVNFFEKPLDNAVAAARTCYSSKGIISPEEVAGEHIQNEDARRSALHRRDALAKDLYQAGHHTTFQHASFQFSMSNISRQFIWSFLHSHPFYNSEQVSQRYVEVKPDNFAVPNLPQQALSVYEDALSFQIRAYQNLIEILTPAVEEQYFSIFKTRRFQKEKWEKDIKKKCQEFARYCLPVATFAYLYHTINGITLLRYHRLCNVMDSTTEQQAVVEKMVQEILKVDPSYEVVLEQPLALEETIEFECFNMFFGNAPQNPLNTAFRNEFDGRLNGHVSRLVDYKTKNEEILADSVREVLGVPSSALADQDAISLVMNPEKNPYLARSLDVTTLSKLSRALFHPSYTFKKKISHTADSQNQRHRLTPASRPCLSAYLTEDPDYITPEIFHYSGEAKKLYEETMEKTWESIGRLKKLGVKDEWTCYLLPNAVALRFTESADLMSLRHKHEMRLCYNAQEEIWKASLDEAIQIKEVNPRIGSYLLPPCTLRDLAGVSPVCPEGKRYCGVPVWKLDLKEYQRII